LRPLRLLCDWTFELVSTGLHIGLHVRKTHAERHGKAEAAGSISAMALSAPHIGAEVRLREIVKAEALQLAPL